jgi:hypothetical protein
LHQHLAIGFAGDPVSMMEEPARDDVQAMRVRNWLLAILRFAVTLEQSDRTVVMTMAGKLDGAACRLGSNGFCFFAKTSSELCGAIVDRSDPQSANALRRHLRRIEDCRLRRALEAAIGYAPALATPDAPRRSIREDLWKGLRQR